MQYPLSHSLDGGFAYSPNVVDECESNIRCILTTLPGQHERYPTYGNHAAQLVFDNPVPGLENQVAGWLKYDIERWEPRVKVVKVISTFDYERAVYRVIIEWIVPGYGGMMGRQLSAELGGGERL